MPTDAPSESTAIPSPETYLSYETGHLPSVTLMSTTESMVDLFELPGAALIFCFPQLLAPEDPDDPRPRKDNPEMATLRKKAELAAASLREQFRELDKRVIRVMGISSQTTAEQQEAREGLKIPFELLSDVRLLFQKSLRLPAFRQGVKTFLHQISFFSLNGEIKKVFHCSDSPQDHGRDVLLWLDTTQAAKIALRPPGQ